MQWTDGPNLGFSNAPESSLYLPVDPRPEAENVAHSMAHPDGLARRVQALLACRRQEAAFGADTPLTIISDGAPGQPLAYLRGHHGQRVLCLLAPKAGPSRLDVSQAIPEAQLGPALMTGPAPIRTTDNTLEWQGPAWGYFAIADSPASS